MQRAPPAAPAELALSLPFCPVTRPSAHCWQTADPHLVTKRIGHVEAAGADVFDAALAFSRSKSAKRI
jgi:hypothetical protein